MRRWGAASRSAAAALGVSLTVCAATFAQAWRLEAGVHSAVTPVDVQVPELVERTHPMGWAQLLAAVGKAPFRTDRQMPSARYQLPAERRAAMAAANRPAPRAARLTLVGTVQVPGGTSLAALQLPGGNPRLYRVGQTVEGFRLVKVEAGAATLVGPDTSIVLPLAKPGQRGRRR